MSSAIAGTAKPGPGSIEHDERDYSLVDAISFREMRRRRLRRGSCAVISVGFGQAEKLWVVVGVLGFSRLGCLDGPDPSRP